MSDKDDHTAWCPNCFDAMDALELLDEEDKISSHIYSCIGCDKTFELKEFDIGKRIFGELNGCGKIFYKTETVGKRKSGHECCCGNNKWNYLCEECDATAKETAVGCGKSCNEGFSDAFHCGKEKLCFMCEYDEKFPEAKVHAVEGKK